MAAAFEIKLAKNKEFYFNLKAANGEVILTSETYKTRAGAKNGITSVTKNGPDCLQYDMKMDKPRDNTISYSREPTTKSLVRASRTRRRRRWRKASSR